MADQWERFQKYLYRDESLGVSVDISRMRFQESFFQTMEKPMLAALSAMSELEKGAIANPDEKRQVGHYWLRAPEMAPSPDQRRQIDETYQAIRQFAEDVHQGRTAPAGGGRFRNLLLIGIGGSALGPQFIADALGFTEQPLQPYFLDNTDPDGIDRVFSEIGDEIGQTLTVVTSKSGRTKETRNGMLEAQAFYERAGLEFGSHAVAITDEPSDLDSYAVEHHWLRRFPMWDWVGGRTSVFSAVGMLPAALLGFDIGAFREGARQMDAATRNGDPRQNPAALLALMWYLAGNGRGDKDMVVLPYKDRLALFPRYLQQLVMESLGKELDLQGRVVNQGLVVYGNKGSTDQHAYVQQLRGGANNFFVTFIEVLTDRSHPSVDVDNGITSGDYLNGFLQGTRQALFDKDRESLTITLERADAASVGKLIALFDRAVGLYAGLIGINAYNQPGVEAGKIAAERVIRIQGKVFDVLRAAEGPLTAAEAADAAGEAGDVETVFHVLRHLSANPGRGVKRTVGAGAADDHFEAVR